MNKPTPPMAQLVIKNLTLDVTPETLSDYLWLTLGLNCPPEFITLGQPGCLSGMAFVHLSRECLAEFLRRYLEGQQFNGNTLVVEAAQGRGNGGKHHPGMPKVNRPKVLLQK
jgi:hypothetical protein